MNQNQNQQLPVCVFLTGPTASGKSDLAVSLTKQLPFEIISVDSVLIYRGMDIGAAKPNRDVLTETPHHLIDIIDPVHCYSAAEFRKDVLSLMSDITLRDKIPLLVGGTMMYFKVLKDGMAKLPSADAEVRDKLYNVAKERGWDFLHQQLLKVDPGAALRIKPSDTQRLQRALEVYELTGRPLSLYHLEQKEAALPYRVVNLVVMPKERAVLHERIAQRFRQMLTMGFLEEVQALYSRGDMHASMPSVRAVGYRQAWSYLDGELFYDEMVEKSIAATRQMAKRQLTWLKSWSDVNWLDTLSINLVEDAMKLLGGNRIK